MFKFVCIFVTFFHMTIQTSPLQTSTILGDLYANFKQAIAGFRAKTKLLKDTTLDLTELASNQRVFNKKGSYTNAVNDFKSVNPINVLEYTLPGGSKGMTGTVGDRTIMIRKSALNNKGSLTISRLGGKDYVIRYSD